MPDSLRVLASKYGAYKLHAMYDSKELTAPARAAFNSKFEREVDPEGKLPPEERARRAVAARKAHYVKMAYESAKKRRRKKFSK